MIITKEHFLPAPITDPNPHEIIAVARPLGIEVHDHLIMGEDWHTSLKALRLI